MLDETFVNEVHEGGANCAATGAEGFAKLGLDEPLAGGKITLKDSLANCFNDGFAG